MGVCLLCGVLGLGQGTIINRLFFGDNYLYIRLYTTEINLSLLQFWRVEALDLLGLVDGPPQCIHSVGNHSLFEGFHSLKVACVGVWMCGCVGVWICGCVGV